MEISYLQMGRRESSTMPANEVDTSNLPSEIIYTILLKMPAKCLIKCKCVCKLWLHLISKPEFVKTHLTKSIQSDCKRIFCSPGSFNCYGSSYFSIDCELPAGGDSEDSLDFPVHGYTFDKNNVICCSCNGLVLLGFNAGKFKVFYLWNPSIRAHRKISVCPYPLNECYDYSGLCYSSIDDEYKLVIVFSYNGKPAQSYVVFRFKTNSWAEARQTSPRWLMDERPPPCVNGLPHWIIKQQKGNMIMYFDSANESFKEMALPLPAANDWSCTSANIRGCLGICTESYKTSALEVWVMMEYGEKESWTIMVSVPKVLGPGGIHFILPRVLGLTKKGEVMVHLGLEVIIYDPVEEKEVRRISVSPSVVVCLDSLVTPNAIIKGKCYQFSLGRV